MGTKDKRVDAYIAKSAPFAKPILVKLRAAMHAASREIDEDIKWGMPFFCYKGKLLANMSAFKQHAAFGFFSSANVMGKEQVNREVMGSFGRLTAVSDLPSDRVFTGYVKKAVLMADARLKAPAAKRSTAAKKAPKPLPKTPPMLAAALRADAVLAEQWKALSPSHRREYLDWILDAKQEATRERRLATTVAQVREGKSQHWKYQAKRK